MASHDRLHLHLAQAGGGGGGKSLVSKFKQRDLGDRAKGSLSSNGPEHGGRLDLALVLKLGPWAP